VEHREERIIIETARYRVVGVLQLPAQGYGRRMTDFLNAPERSFLALTDVEIVPLEGPGWVEQRAFLALSIEHIVLAMPADPPGAQEAPAATTSG
jgi:uncharacterized protein DUF6812